MVGYPFFRNGINESNGKQNAYGSSQTRIIYIDLPYHLSLCHKKVFCCQKSVNMVDTKLVKNCASSHMIAKPMGNWYLNRELINYFKEAYYSFGFICIITSHKSHPTDQLRTDAVSVSGHLKSLI